jgi:hypothetical protein
MKRLISLLAAALLVAVVAGSPASATVQHATSAEASRVCNATMPAGISGDVVLHAHRLADIPGLGRNYQCETWNFVVGSGSHGSYYKALFLFSCACPFGPFDVVYY